MGLAGFGGVLPIAHHSIVQERRWLTESEFTNLLSLCQFLPGGNVLNLSIAVGLEFGGVPGAFVSIVGILTAPSAIVIALGAVFTHYQSNVYVQHLFGGLAAAAAGLLISTVLKLANPLRTRPLPIAAALVTIGAIAILRLPLLPTMIVLAPLSIAAAWRWSA
ncbi:MAG: chromate transporter [Chloroflexi bacterium]|nr:chromate transporter [Chloroflexota bacterium]